MEDSSHPPAALHSEMPASTEISSTATPISALESRSGRLISKTMDNESQTSGSPVSSPSDENEIHAFPFLKLPAEIRVRIYRYLLHSCGGIRVHSTKDSAVPKDIVRRRFPYKDCDADSAYFGKMVTYKVDAPGVHPAILSVNRRTYLEASKLFYSENLFTFLSGTATIIPFLEDRSEGSRRLIKQIELCFNIILLDANMNRRLWAHWDHIFENTCKYLSRFLQLEHMTLMYFGRNSYRVRDSTTYEDFLSNIDKHNWVQQLVPLVKNLKNFRSTTWDGGCDDEVVLAVQTYLRSTMDSTSKKMRQTQNVQEPAHDAAAPVVQHGLGA